MRLDPETLRDSLILADGGWSSVLRARGLGADQPAEMANIEQPEIVIALARAYVDAGSRILCTNTFAASRFLLERWECKADVAELNRAGVRCAREAIGDSDVALVGTLGPSGKLLLADEVSQAALQEAVREQGRSLLDAGVDALLLETFSEPAEAALAVCALREMSDLPLIASFSFDSGPQRTRTTVGTEAAEVVTALEDAGVDILGCNCGGGAATALPAVVALRAVTELPLWVKPNVGLPELDGDRAVYRQTPEEFAKHVEPLLEAGANVIGGCCGVGPEHIARVARLVRKRAG